MHVGVLQSSSLFRFPKTDKASDAINNFASRFIIHQEIGTMRGQAG